MKMMKLEIYGGFHNSRSVKMMLPAETDTSCMRAHELPWSENQRAKLNRHFCGIKGCTCGGLLRAELAEITQLK